MAAFEGCSVADVRCRSGYSRWTAIDPVDGFNVVLVRRGCFRRRVGAREEVVHPGIAYFEQPDVTQQVAHPYGDGHQCTVISLSPELVGSSRRWFPTHGVFIDTQIDLRHRRLLAACRSPGELVCRDAIVELTMDVLSCYQAPVATAARPETLEARRRIVERAREALTSDMALTLSGLCRELTISPFHLSRIFREQTGETISAYRNRLRVRVALEQLSKGAGNLARVATDLGFSDHAHLTRVVCRETGMTPSQLRKVL